MVTLNGFHVAHRVSRSLSLSQFMVNLNWMLNERKKKKRSSRSFLLLFLPREHDFCCCSTNNNNIVQYQYTRKWNTQLVVKLIIKTSVFRVCARFSTSFYFSISISKALYKVIYRWMKFQLVIYFTDIWFIWETFLAVVILKCLRLKLVTRPFLHLIHFHFHYKHIYKTAVNFHYFWK